MLICDNSPILKSQESFIAGPALRYDLHAHTTASDGELTPTELLIRAESRQVDVIAITDHDTLAGLEEAIKAKQEMGLKPEIVNGVEISTAWHGYEIHIVGLAIDPSNDILTHCLSTQLNHRDIRAKAVGDKLAKLGFPEAYELASSKAKGRAISRTHFARALVDLAAVSNFDNAFKKYLGKGKKAYVSAHWMDIESAIKIIHQAGGIAVLAHPIRYDMTNKWRTRLIEEFAQLGGDALEVVLSQQAPNQRDHMANLANDNGLWASMGSDFHRPAQYLDLGKNLNLPEKCKPVWEHPRWRTA